MTNIVSINEWQEFDTLVEDTNIQFQQRPVFTEDCSEFGFYLLPCLTNSDTSFLDMFLVVLKELPLEWVYHILTPAHCADGKVKELITSCP